LSRNDKRLIMIKQVVLVVNILDDETSDDIQEVLNSLPIANGADIIVSDNLDSAISVLTTINAKGAMN
jgi:hypothetical protein